MTDELNTLLDESVALLREMVAIPSPSFEEARVCSHIEAFLCSKSLAVERFGDNLVCELVTAPSARTLMLCAHIDTVSPASDYDFDPLRPDAELAARTVGEIRGESLNPEDLVPGLGSNDDGASVVSFIAVFRYFSRHPELLGGKNLILALSCQEERSGANGMNLLWGERLSGVDFAIVGEPTGMRAAVSERGLLVLDAVAEGVSGHAARNEGVNSIYKALDDIEKLRSHKFAKVSPVMGEVHLNVTQVNAGTAHNVIPDKCTFVVDIRTTEQYTNRELYEELSAICGSTLTPRNLANRSSATRPDSPLLRAAADCGIETFSSPTTSDWMRISCDALKMGPGESSRSHKKNEYVLRSEIAGGIDKYIEFIKTLNI